MFIYCLIHFIIPLFFWYTYFLKIVLIKLKLKYPTIDLRSNGLPSYLIGDEYRNPKYNSTTDFETNQLETSLSTLIKWDIIDPERKPEIAIKRLSVDKAKNALKMILEDLTLRAKSQYYQLQTVIFFSKILQFHRNFPRILRESHEIP